MAAFNHVRDLYDVALKPRLLRSLLKEQVPDETRPFRNPSSLSSIVSILKTHELLSESILQTGDQKHVSSWRSSIDSWVDRILMLARNDLPDKCWVGVCLIGVTINECSSERFVASYNDWFNALLPHIQVEGAIVSKIMSGSYRAESLKKLASCLALLPKSKGDEDSWSLMMQKILLSLSSLLNEALESLEEESRLEEAVALLVPLGKDPPPPFGGQIMAGESSNKGESSHQLLISTILSLMNCCCTMLTSSYPVQVAVPVHPVLV